METTRTGATEGGRAFDASCAWLSILCVTNALLAAVGVNLMLIDPWAPYLVPLLMEPALVTLTVFYRRRAAWARGFLAGLVLAFTALVAFVAVAQASARVVVHAAVFLVPGWAFLVRTRQAAEAFRGDVGP